MRQVKVVFVILQLIKFIPPMLIKSTVVIVLFLAIGYTASSQELINLGITSPWNDGHVILSDGQELHGLIRYNDVEGFITYKADADADEQELLQENEIQSFDFF